jgi:hypothetical protein
MLISGKGGASHKVVGKLLTQVLIEEIPARGAMPIWRRVYCAIGQRASGVALRRAGCL